MTVLTTRRAALVSLAALLPVSVTSTKKAKRRRCRRPRRVLFLASVCTRGFCPDPAPGCGDPGDDCHCLGAGAGVSVCVQVPSEDAPPCDEACHPARVCLETCGHPGEQRCYRLCPSS